jgi:hypothetical protein
MEEKPTQKQRLEEERRWGRRLKLQQEKRGVKEKDKAKDCVEEVNNPEATEVECDAEETAAKGQCTRCRRKN